MTKRIVGIASSLILAVVLAAGLSGCGSASKNEAAEESAAGRTMNTQINVPDGTYRTEVTAAAKNGNEAGKIQSPATVLVKNGEATAVVIWDSSDYTHMVVGGKKIDPVSTEGGATFRVPVPVFDEAFVVTVEASAEKDAQQTEYSLTFASSGLGENAADVDEELAADREASEKAGQSTQPQPEAEASEEETSAEENGE